MSLNYKVLAINNFHLIQHWNSWDTSFHWYRHVLKIRPYLGLCYENQKKKFTEFRILIRDRQLFISL